MRLRFERGAEIAAVTAPVWGIARGMAVGRYPVAAEMAVTTAEVASRRRPNDG